MHGDAVADGAGLVHLADIARPGVECLFRCIIVEARLEAVDGLGCGGQGDFAFALIDTGDLGIGDLLDGRGGMGCHRGTLACERIGGWPSPGCGDGG